MCGSLAWRLRRRCLLVMTHLRPMWMILRKQCSNMKILNMLAFVPGSFTSILQPLDGWWFDLQLNWEHWWTWLLLEIYLHQTWVRFQNLFVQKTMNFEGLKIYASTVNISKTCVRNRFFKLVNWYKLRSKDK